MTTKINQTINHKQWIFDYSKINIYDINNVNDDTFFHFNHYNGDNHSIHKNNYLLESDLEDFRRAALIHKVARRKAKLMLFSGGKVADLVNEVESIIIKLCKQDKQTYFAKGSLKNNDSGIAFPVGVNINNVIAHDSKLHNDERIFYRGDVVKIDIGVHVNGRIIDSAFTHIITDQAGVHDDNHIYNTVLDASRDSMFNAIKMCGVDQNILEISETIQEVINSYDINDTPIVPIYGIGGHNILKHKIHGDKLILSVPNKEAQDGQRIEEDEIYAIETYASNGFGSMTQNNELSKCSHFMFNQQQNNTKINKMFKTFDLYNWIQTRNGLPFSLNWIDNVHNNIRINKFDKSLKYGIENGLIVSYPPLLERPNSVVAQFEHTIHINENSIEIFSLDTDY